MAFIETARRRPAELSGKYDMRGQYRMCLSTGAVTLIAARTATAGQILTFRWGSSTGVHAYIRYVAVKFTLTTGFDAAQEVGCDMIVARSFTVSPTNGTAIDTGGTVTNTGELMTSQLVSLVTSCRTASTSAITAGTHTLDANPIAIMSDWAGAKGDTVPKAYASRPVPLWDARGDESPIVLAQDEGFVVRNLILMGASGVGRWDFIVEWDEGTPTP